MEELQRKRADILKANIEKSKQDAQKIAEKKRKLLAVKEQRKQADAQILKEQKDDKAKQRAEFFSKIKKQGGNTMTNANGHIEA